MLYMCEAWGLYRYTIVPRTVWKHCLNISAPHLLSNVWPYPSIKGYFLQDWGGWGHVWSCRPWWMKDSSRSGNKVMLWLLGVLAFLLTGEWVATHYVTVWENDAVSAYHLPLLMLMDAIHSGNSLQPSPTKDTAVKEHFSTAPSR